VELFVEAPENLTQHLSPTVSVDAFKNRKIQNVISVAAGFTLLKFTRGCTSPEADEDCITHCLIVVEALPIIQAPVLLVVIRQSLISNVEADVIQVPNELEIRHSVIVTVPDGALIAVPLNDILHPNNIWFPAPDRVTEPFISNPEAPSLPEAVFMVIFPLMLHGWRVSPV
jgi:hypothetical protein